MYHILAIGVHPDDIELSCAGTIINHTRLGHKVAILDLTAGELGTRGTSELRLQEAANAAAVMGVAERLNAKMADGFFYNDNEHRLRLISYIRYFKPQIVLANAIEDRHPDHGRAGSLIEDSCFLAGLSKIETEWEGEKQTAWRPKRVYHYIQDRPLPYSFAVDISASFDTKMKAIQCYQSQFHNPNSNEPITYIATGNFLNQLKYRDAVIGKQIGVEYAEGFVSKNVVGIANLDALLLPELA